LCGKAKMTLLNEIVSILSDENGSLNQALLKTKVLLHKLDQQELTSWVNNELNGYGKEKEVPQYRVVNAQVFGNLTNGYWQHSNTLLPIHHLSDRVREYLEKEKLRHALSVLEQFANKQVGKLVHNIPPEYNGSLGNSLSSGYWVENAWGQIEFSQVVQVLTEIRSRLLDFILELQSKLGDNVTDANLKNEAAMIDTPAMFAQSIFGGNTTFGDNTTFVLGHGNNQQVTNVNIKGDFSALAKKLTSAGVEKEDVEALKESIDADTGAPEHTEKKFGLAVRRWMHKMMGKAIDLSWQIEINIAGGLLTNALQAYYFS
jgi:AbiTii